jgi:HK97 gp10 family phage protein
MKIASIKGLDELKSNFKKLSEKYGKAVTRETVKGAELVKATAIKSIQTRSSGQDVIRYRNGGGSYNHVASKVGDAPNTDTGALVRSINVEIRPDATYVGTTLEYAPWLEFGTKNMGERPFLNPALEQNKKQITSMISNAMKGVK